MFKFVFYRMAGSIIFLVIQFVEFVCVVFLCARGDHSKLFWKICVENELKIDLKNLKIKLVQDKLKIFLF